MFLIINIVYIHFRCRIYMSYSLFFNPFNITKIDGKPFDVYLGEDGSIARKCVTCVRVRETLFENDEPHHPVLGGTKAIQPGKSVPCRWVHVNAPVHWAATRQNEHCGCAPSEDSDQSGHPPSLIRAFVVRMKKPWVLRYPLSAQQRLWSDWADAQADLSLGWAHMPLC